MAEDAEVPMEENAGESSPTELLTGNNETDKDEFIKHNETDTKMLEDETMPTYTSITSITVSSKQEDPENNAEIESCPPENNKSQENCEEFLMVTQKQAIKRPTIRFEEDDECPVVDLSSSEEDIEDEKDSYSDDEEPDEDEYVDDVRGNKYRPRMASDDEECDDIDTMDYDMDSDEGHSRSESGDDVEADQFERSSDDYQMTVRSPTMNNLRKEDKERSKSLQNLSFKSRSNGIKRKICHYNPQDSANRYNNIPNKSRHYNDIVREPNMINAEQKRLRKQALSIYKESDPLFQDEEKYESDYHPINIPQDEANKQYLDINTINDQEVISSGKPIIRELVENGVELKEVLPITDSEYSKEKSQNFSIQKLNYDDYMQGNEIATTVNKYQRNDETNGQIEEIVETIDDSVKISKVESLMQPIINDDTDSSLLKTQVINLELEIEELKKCLSNSQNENEKNKTSFTKEYNDVVNKNLELTKEMNEMRKVLLMYQEKENNQKLKVSDEKNLTDASVQTENPSQKNNSMSHLKPPGNVLSSSSLGSVVSSTEHWTDSNCSPAISLKPPNVESILNNTDDSFLHGGKTTSRPLSQAFFTSSRILQTLANITQGRPDPANPNTGNSVGRTSQGDIQGQSNVPNCPSTSSRKRKAESPERQPPFKIPTLVPNAFRRIFNSPSNADGGKTKKNGELYKSANDATSENPSHMIVDGATLTPEKQNIESGENDKQENAEEIALGDGIKCFVYHEDDDSEERSFLIQASESVQMTNGKGIVRECGPYLLKNIEVRMSEANGTINIWGKEIKNESSSEEIDENLEDDEEELTNTTNAFWQRTSNEKFKSPYVGSAEKKTKQHLSSSMSSSMRGQAPRFPLDHHQPMTNHFGSMPNLDRRRNSYTCQKQQIETPMYKPHCRPYDYGINDREYPCETEIVSNQNKHVCQRLSNPHSSDGFYNSRNENPCCQVMDQQRASPIDSIFLGSNDRLIRSEKSSPISEIRRHRLRGKKVRGILMDFFKGCGQCKDTHTTNENHFEPSSIPDIRVTPAFDTASGSKKTSSTPHNPTCHRNCCDSYSKRIDVTDLERQIQVFRVDMEKMLSRSDAFLDMLNVLQNMDSR